MYMKVVKVRGIIIVAIVVVIIAFIVGFAWATCVLIRNESFLSLSADNARVIYETRSIASYATVIIITSAVAFIPLLTLLWSTAKQSISNTLDLFVSLLGNPSVNQSLLKQRITKAHDDIENITSVGEKYRGPFFACGFFIILTLFFFLFVNFLKLDTVTCYRCVVILNGLSILVFFFLLFLFSMYQFEVRPKIRLYEDRSVFKGIYIWQP